MQIKKSTINRDKKYNSAYRELGNSENRVFPAMRDVMIFAASLAVKQNLLPLPVKDKDEPIKVDLFANYIDIMDIIGIYHTKDIDILTNENIGEKIQIFEEYANAGMKFIYENTNNDRYRETILNIVEKYRPETNKIAEESLVHLKYE